MAGTGEGNDARPHPTLSQRERGNGNGPPSLDGLLAGVTKENVHAEIDFGLPVGREVW